MRRPDVVEALGLRGRLISASFVRDLFAGIAGPPAPRAFIRSLESWQERTAAALGPAASVRAIADAAIIPLLRLLEFEVSGRRDVSEGSILQTRWAERRGPDVLVAGWQAPLGPAWRAVVLHAIAGDNRWAFCTNGVSLRVVDARRTWTRDHAEFDLEFVHRETEANLLWALARGSSISHEPSLLDRAVELSARHGTEVCRTLGRGVLDAVGALVEYLQARRAAAGPTADLVFEQSLTVLYRVLFLLFAEARRLVPVWHPVYRDRYTLDSIVGALLEGGSCRGLWHAVQAIARLAHAGCVAGELRVNAFNGRLFSPSDASVFDRAPVPDDVMARAILAVSSQPAAPRGHAGRRAAPGRPPASIERRRRILYRDLDVEQLGAVYEQALEYQPASAPDPAPLRHTRDTRKSSGTFYTPRAVTEHLIRRTLGPLVEGRTAAEILDLRVLDPAMGSGAFLVGACRFLSAAAERAFVSEGRWHAGDITPADRLALRRQVVLRCLYGADSNPMAVQLARLSLWLATLAADRPLSFLDHRLVAGDSLVGASPDDIARRPSRIPGRVEREAALPLFPSSALGPALERAVGIRSRLALRPDDSVHVVHWKERELGLLSAPESTLGRWKALLDLWCAGWFWTPGVPPGKPLFAELADVILHGRATLPTAVTAPLLERARAIARERRFLHWPLVFPEVFTDEGGRARANAGFDAVLGNPPWDMVRGDSGDAELRASRRTDAHRLGAFARESGVYQVDQRAHVNRYQLFVQRALQLVRRGGRIGLVLPSGVASDAGTAALRRHLLDHADVDGLIGFDNREAIFPIHRSVRFALVTATAGAPTQAIACRFGLTRGDQLDTAAAPAPLVLTRALLARVSGGDDLGIPELASEMDLRIVEGITARVPRLEHADGWHVKFGRELNASDDRAKFTRFSGSRWARAVVEGKQVDPFRVRIRGCRYELREDAHLPPHVGRHVRLAYRDVASATNRLTLIAALLPARAVSTHTLFCLKTLLPASAQRVLCALLNSFVANYLVRLRVTTHVTVALVSRLPVPPVHPAHAVFLHLAALSRTLSHSSVPAETMPEYAEMQAICARLYGLTAAEFEHVLGTFPLIEPAVRRGSLDAFLEMP